MFNSERDRLKDRFPEALLQFVGDNPTRYYWCAAFLDSDSYLQGRKPERLLSQMLLEQGLLILCERKNMQSYQQVRFRFRLAVSYQRMGFTFLAAHHKRQLERLQQDDPVLGGWPACDPDDDRVYDAIKTKSP